MTLFSVDDIFVTQWNRLYLPSDGNAGPGELNGIELVSTRAAQTDLVLAADPDKGHDGKATLADSVAFTGASNGSP